MYKVGVVGKFTAIHSLVGEVPETEKTPHPHSYRLEWEIQVRTLDERGFALDIALLEDIRDTQIAKIADVDLNSLSYFDATNTTIEHVADFIFNELAGALVGSLTQSDIQRITTMEVRLWESQTAWAAVSKALPNHLSRG